MSEIVSNINLDAHYSSNPKVERPARVVATAPNTLPTRHLFDDDDANKRFELINNDIYQKTSEEEKKGASKFWKVFAGIVITILGIKGVQKLISILKKS